MNGDTLTSTLASLGAQLDVNGQAIHFGNPGQELLATQTGSVVSWLGSSALIQLSGEDAQVFLNSLLSSDVKHLEVGQSQYTTFSTPKGRMLASMLLSRTDDSFMMQLPSSLQPAMLRKLSMYILRSKVKVTDASTQYMIFGVSGPLTRATLIHCFGNAPNADQTNLRASETMLIQTTAGLHYLYVPTEAAASSLRRLHDAGLILVGENAWRNLSLRTGFTWIYPATQEQFVPQMANMDLVGAVNFKKGCYPGQEIVARTQYLGKLKRRMYRVSIDCPISMAAPGTELFSDTLPDQAIGMIADSAPIATGATEALAVIQSNCWEKEIYIGSSDGPQLQQLALPYPME